MIAIFHIAICRKPLEGTVVENVVKHSVGGLNINGCRIAVTDGAVLGRHNKLGSNGWKNSSGGDSRATYDPVAAAGRWPANLIHDGSDEVMSVFPITTTGSIQPYANKTSEYNQFHSKFRNVNHQGDSGSASRFFKKIVT